MTQNRAITTYMPPLQTVGCYNNRMVKSSPGTTPTLSFTSSSPSQEHPSLSGVLDYSYPLLLVNTQSSKQLGTTTKFELKFEC